MSQSMASLLMVNPWLLGVSERSIDLLTLSCNHDVALPFRLMFKSIRNRTRTSIHSRQNINKYIII